MRDRSENHFFANMWGMPKILISFHKVFQQLLQTDGAVKTFGALSYRTASYVVHTCTYTCRRILIVEVHGKETGLSKFQMR